MDAVQVFGERSVRGLSRLLILAVLVVGTPALAKKVVYMACVDCYGSASFYPQVSRLLFPDLDIRWIHIQTEQEIPRAYLSSARATRGEYEHRLVVDPEVSMEWQNALALMRMTKVRRVIGGMERGAQYADRFNYQLGLPGNDPVTSHWRREKDAAQRAVGDMGIPTLYSSDRAAILAFIDGLHSDEIVVKPNASSAGQYLSFISRSDRAGIWQAVESMLGKLDLYGQRITGAIIQPALVGDEYVANTISYQGRTELVGVWKYHKYRMANGKLVYFLDVPLDLSAPEARELAQIMPELNRRLGNRIGPGHTELIRERGTGRWYFVEQGARVGGTALPMVEAQIYGTSHLHQNLLLSIEPERYLREIGTFTGRKLKEGVLMSLLSPMAGHVRVGTMAQLRRLSTYFAPAPHFEGEDGTAVEETVDLNTSPFTVFLVGEKARVEADARTVVRWQGDGTIFEWPRTPGWLGRCGDYLARQGHTRRLLTHFRALEW